eukprot:m.333658 g.333658  ORF g.333658 m.333658 type:complete len:65 (-) comp55652_c0_seq2:1078-1272(-)
MRDDASARVRAAFRHSRALPTAIAGHHSLPSSARVILASACELGDCGAPRARPRPPASASFLRR